ncbi:MAG: mechanosensitive ion channel family protein [Candidatus Binatia bacterium]
MIQRWFDSLVPIGQAPGNLKEFLESLVKSLAGMVAFLLERITAIPPQVQWAIIYREVALYGVTSAALLAVAFAIHVLIFSILRRRIERRRKEKGSEDAWVLFLEAIRKPLKLAFWVYSIYFVALPLLLLLQPGHSMYPVRLLFEKAFDLGLFGALYWLLYRLVHVVEIRVKLWAGDSRGGLEDLLIELIGKTFRIVIPVAAVIAGLPLFGLPPSYDAVVGKASSLLIVGAISWMLFHVVDVGEQFVLRRYDLRAADNLRARQIYTQVHVLKKTLYVIISVFAVASGLMLFEQVRSLGASVLASAGVVGIIIGFAAQRTIANLFAGFQLALTQPIRLDDVVIVENEWGRIEEITLTYVVVRVWDMRRLIVPLSYFIEQPFQNWTRQAADILGTVFIHTDYTISVQAVREELKRIVAQSSDWDGKVCVLQVTNATERSLELRALASSSDASKAWDLRCEIREKLVAFVQENYPRSLPRVRAELEPRNGAVKEN